MNVAEKIKQIVADKLVFETSEVSGDSSLVNDLGADSLDMVEIVMESEVAFQIAITDDEMESIKTVDDLITVVSSKVD